MRTIKHIHTQACMHLHLCREAYIQRMNCTRLRLLQAEVWFWLGEHSAIKASLKPENLWPRSLIPSDDLERLRSRTPKHNINTGSTNYLLTTSATRVV